MRVGYLSPLAACALLCTAASGSAPAVASLVRADTGEGALARDLHVPVSGKAALKAVTSANKVLNAALGNAEVDFGAKHTPHVTLYLSRFSCPNGAAGTPEPCEVTSADFAQLGTTAAFQGLGVIALGLSQWLD